MDNAEAVEKLAGIMCAKCVSRQVKGGLGHMDYLEHVETAKAILATIQADPMAYVKPKPLEWVEENDRWVATIFDVEQYIIGYDTRSSVGRYSLFIRGEWTPYHTLEAAQAAAYEDLCNRVKELF